ncbi:DUF5305 family protein [Natronincola ferrireducens]|uniref:DUF5305 domain-containing protein n=1 Tax=Natronincola ferrireducens TaxID=393762 RepID=A0A1G8XW05_9FIRM|nr:DUF5305 family protein [Natronincola ferrireducens]SDJ94728.1 hypothetical protein SAMN05660472_00345 [Natronincola ferrireducens]
MKIVLNKNLRISLILILTIIIGITSFSLYNEMKKLEFKEEQVSLYSYRTNSDINYEVFLKSNILFDKESLEEGEIYFTEFVDYIKADFHYGFYGETSADITGDYKVIAVMEGYAREGEGEKVIWQKNFPILPKKSFEVTDKEMAIKEGISFQLDEYNEFADLVAEATKARTSTRLILYIHINLIADTNYGAVEEKISPAIVIPLGQDQFAIEKQLVGEKEESLEETKQVEIPTDSKKIFLYGTPIGIFLIALIYLIFFTANKPPKSKLEKTVSKIFKSHGSRLVALDEEKAEAYNNYYRVRTIEDLVKIADEIEKPILYQYKSNPQNITQFYIVDEASIYVLDLKYLVEESKETEATVEEIKNN